MPPTFAVALGLFGSACRTILPNGLDHPAYAVWLLASNLPVGLETAQEDADADGA